MEYETTGRPRPDRKPDKKEHPVPGIRPMTCTDPLRDGAHHDLAAAMDELNGMPPTDGEDF